MPFDHFYRKKKIIPEMWILGLGQIEALFTEPDRQIRRWNSAFLLLLIVLKKQKTKMVWSYISQFSINKTGHFFHLTSLKFSDMKEAHTFGLRNSLFMAFFSLQYSITRKVGCCFSVKKSWDFNFLLSFFLFFFKTCDHF